MKNTSLTPLPSLTLCELSVSTIPGIESYSPFCLKVHRALKVAKLPYVRRHASNPHAYASINPAQQAPILLVGDEPIPDSTAILRKLESLTEAPWTTHGRTQSEAWLWEEFADTSLNTYLVAARWADPDNWPIVREAYFGALPPIIRTLIPNKIQKKNLKALHSRNFGRHGAAAAWSEFETRLDHLDARAPKEGFWLGDLTVADLSIFAQLQALRTRLTLRQKNMVESRPTLTAYLDRVDTRTQ